MFFGVKQKDFAIDFPHITDRLVMRIIFAHVSATIQENF